MCSGDAHGLFEGRMIPRCNICSNSALAICSLSGANRRGRAKTGGPFVVTWWTTSVVILGRALDDLSRRGKRDSKRENSSVASGTRNTGLMLTSFDGEPSVRSCVVPSSRVHRLESTNRSKWRKKSLPIIANGTAATVKTHGNSRRSFRSRVIKRCPYVAMADLLAAFSVTALRGGVGSGTGITLTSAPVSIRNRMPVDLSVT